MDKWADNLISAVRFNSAGTHIDKVEARPDNGDKVGAPQEMTRQIVISKLHSGVTFCTIFLNDKGEWVKGAMVITETIQGQEYIKTRRDGTKRDNLDNLPTF